ncbi:MAG: 16S rRNA (cytidine(1402)-2'-O)-methyltransferase [Gemmatimonadaceae bacterium]|nr:16S rRNA (cytidine(1402)-2'-O)-methyltransferase [Gemmatimonadaceae bacterium]
MAARAATLWPDAAIPGALHVVSTPIGHLGDITLRALAVLQQAAVICCEDTRHTRALLDRYGIRTPTLAVHEHNEASMAPRLLARLREGEAIALVTDAGTPLVSDPGGRLVQTVAAEGIRVVPIPGASATLAALVASGLAAHPFTVLGFLDRKGKERENLLAMAARLPHAVVLFESPNRLVETLEELASVTGEGRPVAVARELTKHFEEIRRGTLADVTAYYRDVPPRGEIVIVLAGATATEPTEDGLRAAAAAWRAEGFRPRDIVRMLMDEHGASRNLAYRLAHDT